MNALLQNASAPALGWALVHSLWQGTLVGILAWLLLRGLRNRSAQLRYLVACGALLLELALPVGTFLLLRAPASLGTRGGREEVELGLILVRTVLAPPETGLFGRLLPWVLTAWMAGVGAMSLRLAGGWCWLQRLRWAGAEPAKEPWPERMARLARRMGLQRPVRLLQSAAVDVPTVLGWLSPVVLVPAALFAGLDPRALESILAHELAHIRRHDYLVNLLQSAVEALLFYHPAVWWLSAQIRTERENCCDDMAASQCGDPLLYARALAALEDLRQSGQPSPNLALAASGGTLMNRIRRLIAPQLPPSPAARAGLVAALAVSVLGAATGLRLGTQERPKAPEAAPTPETKGRTKTVTVFTGRPSRESARFQKVEVEGKVRIQPEAQPPVLLEEEGARLVIEGRDGERTRGYRAERGSTGETRQWTLEGREVAPDAAAEAWLKASLERLKKLEFRWKEGPGSCYVALDAHPRGPEKEGPGDLDAAVKRLEEQAKLLAERRAAKGASEAEIARIQEELSRQAKALAEEARRAAAEGRRVEKHIAILRAPKGEETFTVRAEGGDPRSADVDVQVEKQGDHVVITRKRAGEVMILRDRAGSAQTEIEALKKAIAKMQERLAELQAKAAKAPQGAQK